jgi:orotidine-5'-phosphate decarboxylase
MVTNSVAKSKGRSFRQALCERAQERRTWLCIGLDPDPAHLPPGLPPTAHGVSRFCTEIIEATADFAVAFKVNFAFFEALGPAGWQALRNVRDAVPYEIPVIADAKRGDIGNTARAYARAVFDALGFDAITVSPYLGWDSLAPFLQWPGRGVFVLCKTSNPGAGDLQDLTVDGQPLYMHVARSVLRLDGEADAGLVVGGTYPDALRDVRSLSDDLLLLVPGIGAQGATMAQSARHGANARGENALLAASRQILYPAAEGDRLEAARATATSLARESWTEANGRARS